MVVFKGFAYCSTLTLPNADMGQLITKQIYPIYIENSST